MRITFDKYDALLPLNKLKASKHQRNKHSKEQIDRLALIMREHGVRHPIHISKLSGEVCFGHGRWAAAKQNKFTEYPVVYQEFKDDKEEYSCVQSDNAIAAWAELDMASIELDIAKLGGDFDIELLGIKDFVLDEPVVAGCDEDEVPEVTEPICKLADRWLLGDHVLVCGDSTDVCAVDLLMMGEKADMVFTDPPYGLADKWSGGTWAAKPMYADAKRWDQPLEQSDVDLIISMAPVVIIWGGNYYSMPPSRCWLSWIKSQQMETMADFELAWTNLDKPAKAWTGARNADGKRSHPTQKPVALMEWGVSFVDSKVVFDPFGGSGSTLIACEKTNRKCFMMEIDPHYCDVIIARWEKYSNKKAELTNGKAKESHKRRPDKTAGRNKLQS